MEATAFVGLDVHKRVGRAQENDVGRDRRVGPRRRSALPGRDPEHAGGLHRLVERLKGLERQAAR
jgi:hypothetical protein